jgi:hypothetical protein
VKVLTAPGKGTGERGVTLTVVELSGKSSIGAVTAAVEKAKTPHSEKMPPGVTGVLPFKVKSTATLEDIQKALKKAELLEE